MPPSSPINFFRSLLAMTPQQRESALANKSPEIRQRILAKVNEYAALDPDERELRLRATELRLYMMSVLRASPGDRDAKLALVPDDIRGLVKSRLMQWEILPPTLQQEFLQNEHVLSYFSHMEVTNGTASGPAPTNDEQSRWNALPADQRSTMIVQFNQFFELSPIEKQKALGELSGPERVQMEKAMQTFDKLPPEQRIECVRAYAKFVGMSSQERTEFLRNARRWAQMSPAERKAWCDLVLHVPQWPPMPQPVVMPPMPPNFHAVIATNHG